MNRVDRGVITDIQAVLLVGFGVAIGVIVGYIWPWKTSLIHEPKSWIDAASAAGTVGVLVATVWIATRDFRERKKAEVDRALTIAAGMLFRLGAASEILSGIRNEVVAATKIDMSASTYVSLVERIRKLRICDQDERLAVLALAPHAAFSLAVADDRASASTTLLSLFTSRAVSYEWSEKEKSTLEAAETIHDALRRLNEAVDELTLLVEHAENFRFPARG